MIIKEVMNDLKENYTKVRKLLDEDYKNDPESEPYASKYSAKKILLNMKDSLRKLIEMKTTADSVTDAMLGAVYLHIGVIDMETEELSASEQFLTEALNLLESKSMESEIVITLLNVYNNLGILWSNRDRDESEKATFYLLKAKELYENFKCTMQMPTPTECLFNDSDRNAVDGHIMLEKAHTLTLYYLAQIFGVLKQNLKSAIYCHITLKRQLQYDDYEPIDWALNSATLSQFFAERNGFLQSRHHLAASSTILEKYEQDLMNGEQSNTEILDGKMETFKHRSADVARCWVKFCLQLLSSSKNRLMADSETLSTAITDLSKLDIGDEDINNEDLNNLTFSDIDVTKYEAKVTDKFVLTYEDARAVFLCCQSWINKAKEYYKLDTLASDYIEIVQDSSQAYSYLAFFEEDDERQSKMHKRRINMLEELLKEVNPTYYIQYCRQLWYEVGEVYSDILNIKLEKLNKNEGKLSPHALQKINTLCEQSIENYEQFLKSFENKGRMPDKLERDVIRPIITAYCLIARNSMKKVSPDKTIQLTNIMKSYEAYKTVVDICKRDQDSAAVMHEEYSLCQEMVNILPIKIKKIESQLIQI